MAAAAPARRGVPTSLSLILFVLASHLPSDRSAASAKLVVGSLKTGENWAFVSRFCFLSLHGRFQALGSNEPPLVQDPLCSGLKTLFRAPRTSFGATLSHSGQWGIVLSVRGGIRGALWGAKYRPLLRHAGAMGTGVRRGGRPQDVRREGVRVAGKEGHHVVFVHLPNSMMNTFVLDSRWRTISSST